MGPGLLGILALQTGAALTPYCPHPHPVWWWRRVGQGGETIVSICLISLNAIFQEGLLGRLSAIQCRFLGYNLSTVYLYFGILALCCLVSYSSNIPEPCAMFVKIEHKSMSYIPSVGHTQVLVSFDGIKFSHLFFSPSPLSSSSHPNFSPVPSTSQPSLI